MNTNLGRGQYLYKRELLHVGGKKIIRGQSQTAIQLVACKP